jgi:peroxiredoxin
MFRLRKTLLVALLLQMPMASSGWSLEIGDPMPDFGIKTQAGDPVSRAGLAGKPVLLVFWNSWCPNCKKELPQINRMAEKYGPGGLTVLAINTGLNDSDSKARAFWKKNGFLFPTAFDQTFSIGESFGVQGVPTVVLVDAKGVVRYKSPLLPDNMDERIKQLSKR